MLPRGRPGRSRPPRVRSRIAGLALTLLAVLALMGVRANSASAGDVSAQLSLPWATGESWKLLSGIHSWSGARSPASSLDFTTASGQVRAAGPGTIHRDGRCASAFVRIDHGGGWNTSYYHLANIPPGLTEGSQVTRGQLLGYVGTGTPCGGDATPAHVHFTLWKFTGRFSFGASQQASIVGVDLGGWTVTWDGVWRHACMEKGGATNCVGKTIVNDGTIWGGYAETPRVGDFNGDGKSDIASFTQGTGADVWVALGNGSSAFVTSGNWREYFAPGKERPVVGDFNGDGRDDIATFTQGTSADVWVALSNGSTAFVNPPSPKWHDYFSPTGERPMVGDFNADGRDDIVSFMQGTGADVWVALGNGSTAFVTAGNWQGYFAPGYSGDW
jgi:murein DD-endopeptidase MepM/ murein hydrolase activator NlpD